MAGNPSFNAHDAGQPLTVGPLTTMGSSPNYLSGVFITPTTKLWHGPDKDMEKLPYGFRAVYFESDVAPGKTIRMVIMRAPNATHPTTGDPIWLQLYQQEGASITRADLRKYFRRAWCNLFPPAHSPRLNDTLGFRFWSIMNDGTLVSPMYRKPWYDGELIEEKVNMKAGEGAHRGIHAHLVPRDWRLTADLIVASSPSVACGIVERFGKSVVGTKGWRAEWVIIRELVVPPVMRLGIESMYPDAKVHAAREVE